MAYGFQTSQGSLYIVDPQGRTARFKRSEGKGQDEWHAEAHCLYLETKHAGVNLHGPNQYARLAYANENGEAAYFSFKGKSALPRPDKYEQISVIILDKDTDAYVRQIKAYAYPQKGLWPLEEIPADEEHFKSHKGNTITQVFETAAELRAACRAAGLTQVPLPPEYVSEWKAAGSQAAQEVSISQTAKRDFAVQQAATSSKQIANTSRQEVTPAIFKARPARGFVVTK